MQVHLPPTSLLRRPEVEKRTGLKRSTIYDAISKGSFPQPIKIGSRLVCWAEHEIEEWIQEKLRAERGLKA